MEQRKINPWSWQDQYGFSQAIEVTGGERVLYCAGQTSSDEAGNTIGPHDMRVQAGRALDNLETVLEDAGLELANVVRLTFFVTDVDAYFSEGAPVVGERLAAAGLQPASTLVGVARLAFPDLVIELEATAVA